MGQPKGTQKTGVTIEEFDEAQSEGSIEELDLRRSSSPTYPSAEDTTEYNEDEFTRLKNQKAAQYQALVSHTGGSLASSNPFGALNPRSSKDDSNMGYGDQYAENLWGTAYIPPMPSAPPYVSDEDFHAEQQAYEQWIQSSQIVERKHFEKHEEWIENLKRTGNPTQFNPQLSSQELPRDGISENFAERLMNAFRPDPDGNEMIDPVMEIMTDSVPLPDSFSKIPFYIPRTFKKDNPEKPEQAWQAQLQEGQMYDEIKVQINKADKLYGQRSMLKTWAAGHSNPDNEFELIANRNGEGAEFQCWGPGQKVGLKTGSGQMLGKVHSKNLEITTKYFHIKDRCTIVQIAQNEIGFVISREDNNTISKLVPGRYLIAERFHSFIGLTAIPQNGEVAKLGIYDDMKNNAFTKTAAARIQVVFVPQDKLAFYKDNGITRILKHRKEPYILDAAKFETFLNFVNLNDKIKCASDNSMHIISLVAGEYIFLNQTQNQIPIAFYCDPKEMQNMRLVISNVHFEFSGDIYNSVEHPRTTKYGLTLTFNENNQFLVLQDPDRNIRFVEQPINDKPLMLRAPWSLKEVGNQNEAEYRYADNQVVRLRTNNQTWIAALNMEGKIEFIPPLLDQEGAAYYLYAPQYRYLKMINKSQTGVQTFDVPGIGEVSVVNLKTGEIGACLINNAYFFLNPRPTPYVFVAPNQFLRVLDNTKFHEVNGDLHRIFLNPDERAVVTKDGRTHILPIEQLDSDDCKAEGNGTFIFRSNSIQVYGPEPRTKKEYKLGPLHYVNVDVGEVGYGKDNGELRLWEVGEHCIDVNQGQFFSGFFSKNVDPVEVKNFKIVSKHSVTSHIDIYVTYSIVDAEKAIEHFGGKHDSIHEYIKQTIEAEMLKICASLPPIGFTDSDFDPNSKAVDVNRVDEHEEAQTEIEDSFKKHVVDIFHRYGIDLSEMRITKWAIDPEFLDKSREIALNLQDQRAENERKKIELDRKRIAQEEQTLHNEMRLEQAQNEAKIKAASATAEKVAKAESERAVLEIAKNSAALKLETQKIELDLQTAMQKSQAEISKIVGLAEAEVTAAKERADYGGISPEEMANLKRLELLREIYNKRDTVVTHTIDAKQGAELAETNAALMQKQLNQMQLFGVFGKAMNGASQSLNTVDLLGLKQQQGEKEEELTQNNFG